MAEPKGGQTNLKPLLFRFRPQFLCLTLCVYGGSMVPWGVGGGTRGCHKDAHPFFLLWHALSDVEVTPDPEVP